MSSWANSARRGNAIAASSKAVTGVIKGTELFAEFPCEIFIPNSQDGIGSTVARFSKVSPQIGGIWLLRAASCSFRL
jgi:hypothetical protein